MRDFYVRLVKAGLGGGYEARTPGWPSIIGRRPALG